MDYRYILIPLLSSFIFILLIRPIAIKFKLVDFPDERKIHVGNIPLIGGICIFLAVLITHFFLDFNKFSKILFFISLFILIQGVWDDYKNLKASSKMVFQAFLTVIMIYLTDVKLNSLGYFYNGLGPLELDALSIPITIIAVVGLTNAINMIDGLDGLAAIISLIAITALLSTNINSDVSGLKYLLISIVAALVPFMFFNIVKNTKMKIFLGDGGSLFLGFIISWALIYSTEVEKNFSASYGLWCVAIPLFDFLTVIFIRVIKRQELITASTDHLHHFLKKLGLSTTKILLLIFFSGLTLASFGKFIEYNFPTLGSLSFIIILFFYVVIRIYYIFKKNL